MKNRNLQLDIGQDTGIMYRGVKDEEVYLGETVVLKERGKRVIHSEPQKGVRWATFWHPLGRIYRFGRRIRQGVLCRIKRIMHRK